MKFEIRKVIKLGNSLAVTLPQNFVKRFKLDKNGYVIVQEKDNKVIIEPL
jgi:antitoxin component of MazEF toxin-antitoxin module